MNGIECVVKHPDVEVLVEHESLPYEVAKTLSILSNDEDCSPKGPGSVRRLSLELPRNTIWGRRWISGSSNGADWLIMTANGWICNLFNYYTKTL